VGEYLKAVAGAVDEAKIVHLHLARARARVRARRKVVGAGGRASARALMRGTGTRVDWEGRRAVKGKDEGVNDL
jgi:hypothetical protein